MVQAIVSQSAFMQINDYLPTPNPTRRTNPRPSGPYAPFTCKIESESPRTIADFGAVHWVNDNLEMDGKVEGSARQWRPQSGCSSIV